LRSYQSLFFDDVVRLLAIIHRWRLANTQYWLPYEEQIHDLLLADPRLNELHGLLRAQIGSLYVAFRSPSVSELSATYSYHTSTFYGVTDRFTLCQIHANNAGGSVQFGGGMLSTIRITPNLMVVNPKAFRFTEASLADVYIPAYVPPPPPTGWVADLEEKGIVIRYGCPTDRTTALADYPAFHQYADLFNQCSDASIQLDSEAFDFHSPPLSVIEDHKLGSIVPIVDLRELGGLAITRAANDSAAVSYLVDGRIEWTRPDLISALKFLHLQFKKQQRDPQKRRGGAD